MNTRTHFLVKNINVLKRQKPFIANQISLLKTEKVFI